jgi:ParB-like chromosome segregation protein Spo0J
MIKEINIKEIKSNPNNPRVLKDDKFKKLVQSLKEFPEMANVRPIVVNTDMIVLGGNMRLRAMQEAGWKKAPVQIVDWSIEKQNEFIIKDNVGFGEWDWDVLANEWNESELTEWGLDLPLFDSEPSLDELIGEEKNKPATMKITFESPEQLQKAEIDIQELLDRKYPKSYFSVSAGEI